MNNLLIPFSIRYPRMTDDFRGEMDRMMNHFFEGDAGTTLPVFRPQANLAETETHWEVTLDLPGMKLEDFNVELKHGELWISGERSWESETTARDWHRRECQLGRFQRAFRLGDDVDPEKVDAEYKNGILRITVPKTEAAQPKRIKIRS